VLPLFAVLTYSATSPLSERPAVLKIALIEALPVARYWQSRHQQARNAIGASLNWKRTAPQKQRPLIELAICSSLLTSDQDGRPAVPLPHLKATEKASLLQFGF
jgi:hypothetical protein